MEKNDILLRLFGHLLLISFLFTLSFCHSHARRHEIIPPASLNVDDIVTERNIPKQHRIFQARFLPQIQLANNNILMERNLLHDIRDSLDDHGELSLFLNRQLNELLNKYGLEPVQPASPPPADSLFRHIEHLLRRVDIVPVKLVMAQAIIESGWGTSDFAREGNNYFGIRCYEDGCGLPPSGVDSVTFWVKAYPNEMAGIEDYLWTLNTHPAYHEFRQERASMRDQKEAIDPLKLIHGLDQYSEKRDEYVSMVSNIIRNYIPENAVELLKGEG
ncbi:MAG: glucosaminidase domain-containing protein [Bacteroidales bacterium]|nr:glucosaminidase domain-containing protein [Bacteroidales bacterium]